MSEKDNLIEYILKLELNMFLNVPSRYPASCQENPKEGPSLKKVFQEETGTPYLFSSS
jgi:hypothetical protein